MPDRMQTARMFLKLVDLILQRLSEVELRVRRLGENIWNIILLDSSTKLSGVWPRDREAVNRLRSAWLAFFNMEGHIIATSFERPSLGDFVVFALEPTSVVSNVCPDLIPLALCLLTQIAFWLDELPRVSESAPWPWASNGFFVSMTVN